MEKMVYENYAFTENEEEKAKINREIYSKLKEKYKILKVEEILRDKSFRTPTEDELNNNDIVYSRKACYGHGEYKIFKCPEEVPLAELALICDGGNLCFGYSGSKYKLTIFED